MASLESAPLTPVTPSMSRQRSINHSMTSQSDWQERGVSMQDVTDLLEMDEKANQEEYNSIHHKLQTRLETYQGPNPFVHTIPFSFYEKAKIFLFTISGILLVKIIICIFLILLAYIGCCIKNCCCSHRISHAFNLYTRGIARIVLFFAFGLYWIPIKYQKNKKPAKWPGIITPNHVSVLDAFMLYYFTGAVFVAKKELKSIPMIGSALDAIGIVWVDRSSKAARRNVIETIKNYAQDPDSLPLAMFPQGTTSNTLTITQFKCGAFIPGIPVLPTAVHYNNRFCDMALLGGLLLECIHICCQFINFAKIEFLEVYEPNEDEKADANLYASNVRNVVANALNAETTPHTFDDMLLMAFADNLATKGKHIEMAPFIMDDCYRKLSIGRKTVIKLAKIYIKYCDDDGRISLSTFCDVFHIKDVHLANTLFELIMGGRETTKKDGNVNNRYILFDDFLVGVAVCYQEVHLEDALTLFYSMANRGGDEKIAAKDIVNLVELVEKNATIPFGCDVEQFCLRVFVGGDIEDVSNKLSFREFKDNVHERSLSDVVQKFLQFIIFTCMNIKLDENMIVVTK